MYALFYIYLPMQNSVHFYVSTLHVYLVLKGCLVGSEYHAACYENQII